VVRLGSETAAIGFRRIVGRVWIVQGHPEKEGLRPRALLQPLEGMGDDFIAAPFDRRVAVFSRTARVKACVVLRETAVKAGSAGFRVKDHAADEGGRLVSPQPQNRWSI